MRPVEKSLWTAERVPGEVELAIWRSGGTAEPIVCLHGITAQHRAFNALARVLAPSRSLVGVDLRGRGDSGKPESGYGLEAHASDVARVLDHLGLRDAVICGHSMGGFVALETAARPRRLLPLRPRGGRGRLPPQSVPRRGGGRLFLGLLRGPEPGGATRRKVPGGAGARFSGLLPWRRPACYGGDQGRSSRGARPPLGYPRRGGDPLHHAVARTRATVGRHSQ